MVATIPRDIFNALVHDIYKDPDIPHENVATLCLQISQLLQAKLLAHGLQPNQLSMIINFPSSDARMLVAENGLYITLDELREFQDYLDVQAQHHGAHASAGQPKHIDYPDIPFDDVEAREVLYHTPTSHAWIERYTYSQKESVNARVHHAQSGEFLHVNNLTSGEQHEWSHHVATCVSVLEQDGEVVDYVLDPTLADAPLSPVEWRALQGDPKGLLYITDEQPTLTLAVDYLTDDQRQLFSRLSEFIAGDIDASALLEHDASSTELWVLKKLRQLVSSQSYHDDPRMDMALKLREIFHAQRDETSSEDFLIEAQKRAFSLVHQFLGGWFKIKLKDHDLIDWNNVTDIASEIDSLKARLSDVSEFTHRQSILRFALDMDRDIRTRSMDE